MLRATLRSVTGHKLRLILTAMSVVLGVAFVAGTFVLTDSIKATFDNLTAQASTNVDVVVRGAETDNGRGPVPIELADELGTLDGVERAEPDVLGGAVLVGADGTAVRRGGAPTFGFAPDESGSFVLGEGRLPQDETEVAVEEATLTDSRLSVGDTTTVVAGSDAHPVTIVGMVRFGENVSLAGATAVIFDEATTRSYFAPDGTVDTISVQATDGVTQAALRETVAAALPSGAEAVTGQAQAEQDASDFGEVLGFINTFLLVFAGIALFVGAFIIVNTFSMLVAQRTRELALLRALGASRRQVTRSVLGEALVVGVVSSVVGLAVGVGLAAGLKAVFARFGLDIGSGLPVAPRTVVASFVVGIVVTLVAAYFPARRAARIAPVAAMRDDVALPERSLRLRAVIGSLMTLGGAGTLIGGLLADGTTSGILVGVGAVLTLVGVAVVSPVIAPLAVGVLAAPYRRLFGTVGRLARDNALRNPRRTSTTAAALMIGMALVTGVTILASSTRASTASIVDTQLRADFVLDAGGGGGGAPFSGVPTAVAEQIRDVEGVGAVAQLGFVPVVAGEFSTGAIAIDGDDLAENVNLDLISGATSALGPASLLVDETVATEQGWAVGETVELSVGISPPAPFLVAGVYAPNPTIGSLVVDRSSYAAAVPEAQRADFSLYVRAAPGADLADVRAGLAAVVKPFAVVSVQDREQFKDAQATQVNTILYIIYGLLGLAVIIAILGIVNTLALSVFERTREIGLLRAIGMDRRQLKRVIRLESVIIAVFGASLGTVIGLFFGVALQRSLADDGLTELALPYPQLAAFLVAAGAVRVLAAVWPARRAARLDVLKAITTE